MRRGNVARSTALTSISDSSFFALFTCDFTFVSASNMVEETQNATNKPKAKTPKSIYSWTVVDVQKWFRRHCSDYYVLYQDKFVQHDVTGRVLLRINDNSLLRLGIGDKTHREAIWREILKLKLKTDIVEIRDLQRRNTNNNILCDYSIA